MSTSGLKHAVIEQSNLEKRKSRRGTGGRTATLRRAPSDSDCSGETASLSADSDRHRPIPVTHTTLHSRSSRRRGSEWEVLEGLKDGQRFERRPEVFNGYLHKKRKWPLKGWHKRFFVIDGGILVYARSPTDVARGRLHGSVDVGLSVISAKQRRRRIDIDADEFIYHLRAKTPDVFRTWLSVLKAHRLYRQHLLTFGARESVPKSHLAKEDIPATDTSSRETVTRSTSSSLSNTSEDSINSSLKTFAPVSTYLSPDQYNPFSVSNTLCTRCTRDKGKEISFYTGCSESSLCHRKEILSKTGKKLIVSKNRRNYILSKNGRKEILSRCSRNEVLSRNARKGIKSPKKEVVFICSDETGKSSDDLDVSRSEIYNRERKESCFGFKTLCRCNKVDIRPTYFFFAKHRGRKDKADVARLPKSRKCTNLFKYKMKPEPIVYNRGICVLKKRKPIPDQMECSNQTSFCKTPIKKEFSINSLLKGNFQRDNNRNLNSIISETTFVNGEEHTDLESVNMKDSSKCGGNTTINSLDSTKESIGDDDNVSMGIKSPFKLSIKSNEKLSDSLYSSDNLLESAIQECVKRNFSKAGRIKHTDNIFSKMTINKDKSNENDNNISKITVNKDQADDIHLNYGVRERANRASVRTASLTDPMGEIVAIPTIFPNYTKKQVLDLPGWNSLENEVELRNKFYGDIKSKYSERREQNVTETKPSRNNVKLKTETYMNSNESSTDTAQIIKSGVWESMSDTSKEKALEFSISNYKTAKVLVNRDSNCNDITITLKLNKEHCQKDVTTANSVQTKNKYHYCNYQVSKPKFFSPFIKASEKIKSLALKHAAENNGNSELSTENNSKPNEVAITTKVTKTSTTDTISTNSVGKKKIYLKMKSNSMVPCAKSIKSFSTPRELTSSSSSKLKRKSFSDCGTKKILTLYVNNLSPVNPEEKKANAPMAPIPFNYSTLSKIINFKSSTEKKPESANYEVAPTVEKLPQSHDKSTGSTDNLTVNISTTTSMSGLVTTDVKEVSVFDFKETKDQATMPESEVDIEVFLTNISTAPIENLPPLMDGKSYVKCVANQDSKSSLHTLKNPSNSSSVRSFCLPSDAVTIANISEKSIQATYNQLQDLAVNTDFDSDPDSNPESYPGFDVINKYIGSRLLPGAKTYLVPAAAIKTDDYSSSNISTERKKLKEVGSNTTGHIKLFHNNKRRRCDKYCNSKAEMRDFSDQMLEDNGYGANCYCNFGQQYYHTYQVLIDEKVAVTSVKPNINGIHRRMDSANRGNDNIEPQTGLISPSSPTLRGPQAGFVSGTPGGRLASWIVESGGPLENASREIGQAQLSVQQLQRLMDALELQQQVHHDTDVSLEGASPNVKKDRRKFGLRKKKSNSKCTSVDPIPAHLEVSGSHMALSALTAPPSPGGGMPSSVPNSAASLPIACSAVRPQSLPGAESLTGTAGLPLSTFTPEHQLREDFAVLAKDLLASLKSVVGTLVSERSRLRSAMESADQGTPTNSAFVAALRSNLNTALQQNSELRSRLSRIHDTSDIAEMSSMGNNSDPVPRHLRQSMSFSSSCVSASEFFDAEPHANDQSPERAGVIELDGDSSSEAGSLTSEDGASASSDNSDAGSHLRAAPTETPLNTVADPGTRWSRRSALPAPRAEPQGPSLWNLLYKNIGKDLSQISMPVTINEPLNMLQRLCEELEYSELLDAAAKNQDPMERMCLMAAFAVSAYASSSHRAASKPFNPLLGETYECRRTDRDFVFLAEQVSHHPPISACHAESPRWTFWQEARIKTKFWGKSMEFQPCSRVHVKLKASGDHYTWNKVTTCVHNLFGGQRWVDQYGDMHITCQGTDITCKLNFVKASSWSTSRHEVRGSASGLGSRRVPLTGRWSEALYAGEPPHNRCLWRPGAMPAEHELYYGFTRFAMELNELEPDMLEHLPPTDTRFRPDQRALEEGNIEAAEQYKYRLEEAQRERRKDKCEPTPRWFHKSYEYGEEMWVFNNEYWKAREAGFPDHNTRLW